MTQRSRSFHGRIGAVVALVIPLLAPVRMASAQAGLTPLAPDALAYGRSLGEWSAAWYQWAFSIPKASNPVLDTTGQFAAIGQRGPVWFIPSSFVGAGSTARTITVPAGQAVMFALYAHSTIEDPGKLTEAQMRAKLDSAHKRDLDGVGVLELSVDGVVIPDLKRYRVRSPLFLLVLPPENILEIQVERGKTRAYSMVVEGYWVLLPPLPVGEHVIQKGEETFRLLVQSP